MTKRDRPRRSMEDLVGPAPRPGPGRPVADHRQRLVLAQAENVQLKNAALKGEMLARSVVIAEWASILREVRAGLLAAPSRIRAKLPHLTAHDVATIDGVIRAALADLADDGAPEAAQESDS